MSHLSISIYLLPHPLRIQAIDWGLIGRGVIIYSTSIYRPGRLAVINGTMNSAVYQKILKENVRPSVCDLKLKRTWVLQQDNDPKHTSKSTSEWLKKNKMTTLEWPSQSPDLNPIEMLWHDLKKVVHARKPSNVAELQQFCKDNSLELFFASSQNTKLLYGEPPKSPRASRKFSSPPPLALGKTSSPNRRRKLSLNIPIITGGKALDLAALTCSSNGYASMYSSITPFSKTTLDINKLYVSSPITSKISDETEGKSERAEETSLIRQELAYLTSAALVNLCRLGG
ncbi:hypothetical protein QTP70_009088 [Hemibagrus guttatus]|uniref:Tc1-like transposase DDE domain-containing protein n=1 Tax=Hemibagrus guttatus TaxID=175788 RepID=A0AAE0RA23_9TELE|nr:hypothetical protein QTP70_009088 [Hemibagrus guttatus]KAK3570018.1 hypothetical protein QTP86_009160 [Hemibagrus guttatus]